MLTDLQIELIDFLESHTPKLRLEYQVPLLGEGGTCSLFGELDPKPFTLPAVLSEKELEFVAKAQTIVDWVERKTDVDWFGIYLLRNSQTEDAVLTKLAYLGAPSRAEFPVNESFAQISNNSKVALTGEERVVNNVQEFVAQGGEYYTCDPKVKSELCWPILSTYEDNKNSTESNTDTEILGIIDAECFETDCFTPEVQEIFNTVCRVLSTLLSSKQ